jgi:excisionase family DNA binding protein
MNKKEVAEELGKSKRAVERLVTAGRLTPTYQKGQYGDEAVFDPGQVAKVKAEDAAPRERPTSSLASVAPRRMSGPDDLAAVARIVGEVVASHMTEQQRLLLSAAPAQHNGNGHSNVPVSELLTLTRRQAAQLSGLSVGKIGEAINAGELKSRKGLGRGDRILAADLKEWVDRLFAEN